MTTPHTLAWIGDLDGFLRLIDQTLLPATLQYRDCRTVEEVWEAIKTLRIHGAPGHRRRRRLRRRRRNAAVAARTADDGPHGAVRKVTTYLGSSRPTAVNLFWAFGRMEAAAAALPPSTPKVWLQSLLERAAEIEADDRATCRAIGQVGAPLIVDGQGVLTHCNAGGLATADYGTALARCFSPPRTASASRLRRRNPTAFAGRSSDRLGADAARHSLTLICDNMAGQVMKEGRVQPSSSAPTVSPPTATRPTRSAPMASPSSPTLTAFRFMSPLQAARST